MERDIHEYDDIINLPHHQPPTRSHMSSYDRAAQFAPFAALTGYGDAVKETERLTEDRVELYEEEKAALDEKLRFVLQNGQQASITYFKPDRKKSGIYLSAAGNIKRLTAWSGSWSWKTASCSLWMTYWISRLIYPMTGRKGTCDIRRFLMGRYYQMNRLIGGY